jgi:hypothetical protein
MKGWVFWDPKARREVISDSAVFDEDTFPGSICNPIQQVNPNPIAIDLFPPVALQLQPPANNPAPPAHPDPAMPPAGRQDDPAPPNDNNQQDPAPEDPPNQALPGLVFHPPGQGHAVRLGPGENEHQARRICNELRTLTDRANFEGFPEDVPHVRQSRA